MRTLDPSVQLKLDEMLDREFGVHVPGIDLERVLLVPPDQTRKDSWAGEITNHIYHWLKRENGTEVHVVPALGTHKPMDPDDIEMMFGDIPSKDFRHHDHERDVSSIGVIPARAVEELSGGRVRYDINVEINRLILEGEYDIIFSLGQVIPHEVAGMANHSKNIFVGLGGKDFIDKTHYMGAAFGIENVLGVTENPVRATFDHASEMLREMFGTVASPVHYVMTVVKDGEIKELFEGRGRKKFEQAAELSQELNITTLDKPLERVVVYLNPDKYKSTWLGNKAVYRTRKAISDDGGLFVIAPGLRSFGETSEQDRLIRKYGYRGTEIVNQIVDRNDDLGNNLSVAAHLIHGSSEGRFRITYIPGHMTHEEMHSVGYGSWINGFLKGFDPTAAKEGFHKGDDGKDFYFVPDPGLGLWQVAEK